MKSSSLSAKVVLLGDGRVGKTSLIVRYNSGTFNSGEPSTQNASYVNKKVKTKNNSIITLNLWDTAGQE